MENQSGAVTQAAVDLNEGRNVYAGGAALADEQDLRRLMLELLPTHLILDREHMQSLMNEPQTWAPNWIRQRMLLHAGAGVSGGAVLRPEVFDELRARALAHKHK